MQPNLDENKTTIDEMTKIQMDIDLQKFNIQVNFAKLEFIELQKKHIAQVDNKKILHTLYIISIQLFSFHMFKHPFLKVGIMIFSISLNFNQEEHHKKCYRVNSEVLEIISKSSTKCD